MGKNINLFNLFWSHIQKDFFEITKRKNWIILKPSLHTPTVDRTLPNFKPCLRLRV